MLLSLEMCKFIIICDFYAPASGLELCCLESITFFKWICYCNGNIMFCSWRRTWWEKQIKAFTRTISMPSGCSENSASIMTIQCLHRREPPKFFQFWRLLFVMLKGWRMACSNLSISHCSFLMFRSHWSRTTLFANFETCCHLPSVNQNHNSTNYTVFTSCTAHLTNLRASPVCSLWSEILASLCCEFVYLLFESDHCLWTFEDSNSIIVLLYLRNFLHSLIFFN